MMKDLNSLEQVLNYHFKDIKLLEQALTHRSKSEINYERLEFVGDGILDYVIALNLFQKYPQLKEGDLSKIRAALVNQDSLAIIAKSINLNKFLCLGDGEEKSGGRDRESILADSLEAIFAAISLDSSAENARILIEKLFANKLVNASELLLKDGKSLLQEYLQGKKYNLPEYHIIDISGPDHNSTFTVECVIKELKLKVMATGKSKKDASGKAALLALKKIER